MYTGQRPGQTHTNTMPGLVTRSIPLHQIVRSRMPLDMHVAMAMRARVLCCTMNTVSGAGSCRDTGGPSAHVTPEPKTPSKKRDLSYLADFLIKIASLEAKMCQTRQVPGLETAVQPFSSRAHAR